MDISWGVVSIWASYQIRKIAGCAGTGDAGNVSSATTGQWSQHASRHVGDARAVMHAGIGNKWFLLWLAGWQFGRENVIDLPGACTTHNFTYLVRGLFHVSLQRCACANSPYIRVISCSYISICRQYPDMFLLCLASLLLNYQLLAHSRVEYTHILQGRLNSAWAVMCGKYDEIRQNKKDSAKIWNAKNAA